MKNNYYRREVSFIIVSIVLLGLASCKKDHSNPKPVVVDATPVKLGMFEAADSGIYKLLFMPISKVGTQAQLNDDAIFDTGSGGLVLDADGIIPADMITPSGFVFTGDSTVVNGVTITNQTYSVEYGVDNATMTKVYGNLAYAAVTIGTAANNIVIKRVPFFLYYKGIDVDGKVAVAHAFDILGVAPEYDHTFPNGVSLTSPFNFYDPGTGLTKGFKMAALGTSHFSKSNSFEYEYVPGVVTVGLTAADVSSTDFVMHQLNLYGSDGYLPIVPATIIYNGKSITGNVLFDTGTEPYSYIQDRTLNGNAQQLPAKSTVSVATNLGFSYAYTTSDTENLTYVENPKSSGGNITVFGLEFFLNNEYMMNYSSHIMGLKNN